MVDSVRRCACPEFGPAQLFAGDNSVDEKLVGEWDLISFEKDGKKVPEEDFKGMRVRFTSSPGTVTVTKGEKTLAEGTIDVDPAKQPKTINVTITSEGREEGDNFSRYLPG